MRIGCLAAVAAAALLCGVAHPASAAENGVQQAERVEAGRLLYGQQCSRCHGYHMVNQGQAAFDLRKLHKEDRTRFVRSVTQGKAPNMPPWGDVLSPDEIEALWAYVLTGGR